MNSSSAVLLNSQVEEFFKTTVGIRQGCLLSPILFNLFQEKILQESPHDHHASISVCGSPICNLRFAEYIELMEGSSGEPQNLTDRLVDRATAYGMEGSIEKSKIMTNTTNKSAQIVT